VSWLAFGYKGASGNIWKRARGAERDIRLEEKRGEEYVQCGFRWEGGEGSTPGQQVEAKARRS